MDIAALAAELLLNHPTTSLPYDADAATAAGQLNAVNRPARGGVDGMIEYLAVNRSRTNTGTDTTATGILGRIESVALSTVGASPFGATGDTTTMEHIHSARTLLFVLKSPTISTLDFEDTEWVAMLDSLGGGAGNAKAMKAADVAAIQALSQNQQSRASEIGLGKVKVGHVEQARTL